MSEQPLTRRQMRELERQAEAARLAAGGAEDAPAEAPEAPEVAPEPVAEVHDEAATTTSRRALRGSDTGSVPATGQRDVSRRPVAEPTTSASIPAYGSVPIDVESHAAALEEAEAGEAAAEGEDALLDDAVAENSGADSTAAAAPSRVSILNAANTSDDAKPETSRLVRILRWVVLAVAFFILGALIWLMLDRNLAPGGGGASETLSMVLTPIIQGVV